MGVEGASLRQLEIFGHFCAFKMAYDPKNSLEIWFYGGGSFLTSSGATARAGDQRFYPVYEQL